MRSSAGETPCSRRMSVCGAVWSSLWMPSKLLASEASRTPLSYAAPSPFYGDVRGERREASLYAETDMTDTTDEMRRALGIPQEALLTRLPGLRPNDINAAEGKGETGLAALALAALVQGPLRENPAAFVELDLPAQVSDAGVTRGAMVRARARRSADRSVG